MNKKIFPMTPKECVWLLQSYIADPLRRNALFIVASNILNAGFGFLFWLIVAHFYTTEEVGLAASLVSIMILIATYSQMGFDLGLVRFLSDEPDKESTINSCLTLVTLLSILVAIVFVAGVDLWSPAHSFINEDAAYVLGIPIVTGITALSLTQNYVFVALRTARLSAIRRVITGLRLAFLPILASAGVFGVIAAPGIGIIIAVSAGFFFTRKLLPHYQPIPKIRMRTIKGMLGFAVGNHIAQSLKDFPMLILPLVIVNILDSEMGAYFYIGSTIPNMLFVASYSTNFSLLAEVSHDPSVLRSSVMKALKFNLLMLTPAILILIVFGEYILSIFGEEYSEEALGLLRILVVSSLPVVIVDIFVTVMRVKKRVKEVILIYIFIASVTIGVGYALMDSMDLAGIGVAWFVANVIVAIIVILFILNRLRIRGSQEKSSTLQFRS